MSTNPFESLVEPLEIQRCTERVVFSEDRQFVRSFPAVCNQRNELDDNAIDSPELNWTE